MGGEEEEVLRIAKRLDKMVAKKSVVSRGAAAAAAARAFPARGGARPEALRPPPPPPPPKRCSAFPVSQKETQPVLVAAMATPAPHRPENGPRPRQPFGPASRPPFQGFKPLSHAQALAANRSWPRPLL